MSTAASARVRPLEGLIFRDPETLEPIPAEGVEVPLTPFWRRALGRGDVVRCEPPHPPREDRHGEVSAPSGRGGSTSSRRGK